MTRTGTPESGRLAKSGHGVACPYGKTAKNSILNESATICDSVEFVVRKLG